MDSREKIVQDLNLGFINYEEFCGQMAIIMPYAKRKVIMKEIQKILDSEEVFKLQRAMQEKIDEMLASNEVINNLIWKED